MQRILIVEKSDTRRHVLHRLLSGYGLETLPHADFAKAAELLHSEPVNGIVFGWSEFTDPEADDFLALLLDEKFGAQPVLIMADRYDSTKRDWVTRRSHAAMLAWHDYKDVIDSLAKLIDPTPDDVAHADAGYLIQPGANRILFVDDSPTIRASYRRLLKSNGYHVETANSVDEAFAKLEQSEFDIVITDYFMPTANGDRLCARLRDNPATAHVAAAIITGTYLDRVIKDSLDAGATECMFKNEADELFLARVAAMSRSVSVQKSIENDRRRLSGILSSVGEGVFGVDRNGTITFVNPTARRILGWEANRELVGASAHATFHAMGRDGRAMTAEECVLQRAYREGAELHNLETCFRHSGGNTVLVECTVIPLRTGSELTGSVVAFSDITQRKKLEDELVWQASHDSLTKLRNRLYFENQLEAEVAQLRRSGQKSALMYLDLDRFKYINDTAGHTAGDRLLIEVSCLLQSRTRETDLLARVGGDEFVIILRNVGDDDVAGVSDAIHDLLRDNPFTHVDKTYQIECSIGVAWLTPDTVSAEEALADADLACNIAKRHGRNQTHVYSPQSDEKIEMGLDLGWSVRLREALQQNTLTVHYQPIVALGDIDMAQLPEKDGQLWEHILARLPHMQHHYEALIRLRGSNGDVIYPGAFLPTAERFNMMRDLDRWVIQHALMELKSTGAQRPDTVFAINLSGTSVSDDTLLPTIKSLLAEHRIDPRNVIFEITETAAIENLDGARAFIRELSALGCRFALDDFGSGFSSFAHLKHLNVQFIKIDGTFIQGVANNLVDRSIVTSINDVAHALGKRTIAEYVQGADVLRVLKECGVDYVQGYYIARPLELDTEQGDNAPQLTLSA